MSPKSDQEPVFPQEDPEENEPVVSAAKPVDDDVEDDSDSSEPKAPKEEGNQRMDWSRLDETAAQWQNLVWTYVITGLEDFRLQAWLVSWLKAIRENASQWRKNIQTIDDIITIFGDENEIEIEEFVLEKMLRSLPLRWEEHLELLRVFMQSESGKTERMKTLRALMETTFESILANLVPFVRSHTRRYERQITSSSITREDLVGVGVIGIAKALRMWDREKGPFLNYAKIWMTNEILDCLRSQSVVHAKEKMAELQGGLDGAVADLMVQYQREPTPEEVAEHLGKPVETIRNAMRWRTSVVSLDQPSSAAQQSGDESGSLYDVIPSEEEQEPKMMADLDRETLLKMLRKEIEPVLGRTGGVLGFRMETHLLQDADGPLQPLAEAIEILREIGYNNFKAKVIKSKNTKS